MQLLANATYSSPRGKLVIHSAIVAPSDANVLHTSPQLSVVAVPCVCEWFVLRSVPARIRVDSPAPHCATSHPTQFGKMNKHTSRDLALAAIRSGNSDGIRQEVRRNPARNPPEGPNESAKKSDGIRQKLRRNPPPIPAESAPRGHASRRVTRQLTIASIKDRVSHGSSHLLV